MAEEGAAEKNPGTAEHEHEVGRLLSTSEEGGTSRVGAAILAIIFGNVKEIAFYKAHPRRDGHFGGSCL